MSKGGGYATLPPEDARKFLSEANASRPYKMKGHSFVPLPNVGRNYCKGCGLVRLHNKITDWCVSRGCNFSDSPHYKAALKRLTKRKI